MNLDVTVTRYPVMTVTHGIWLLFGEDPESMESRSDLAWPDSGAGAFYKGGEEMDKLTPPPPSTYHGHGHRLVLDL